MKKMLARFGMLGMLAGLAGMSYSMPVMAAASDNTGADNNIVIIIWDDQYYELVWVDLGIANPGGETSLAALDDSAFDR